MQIILNLPDDIGHELKKLPDADIFVAGLVRTALQQRKPHNEPLSKWARLAECIEETSIGLGDYTEQFKQDMQEVREGLVFKDTP